MLASYSAVVSDATTFCGMPWVLGEALAAAIAANQVYDTLKALIQHALDWLDARLSNSLLASSGLTSSKFDWLPT